MTKQLALVGFAFAALAAFADAPSISNVKAQQRYPWNGLVDIDYTITGDASGLDVSILVKDLQNDKEYTPTQFLAAPPTGVGTHRATWDMTAEGVNVVSTNIIVTVSLVRGTLPPAGLYCVIDLSGGSSASSYPVSYLDAVPSGGWTDTYKTTNIVLRRIEPGTFMMGGSVETTITKAFYIGVFEVTQKQYELVMGSNPSTEFTGDARPVESVSYDDIRGASDGSGWPASASVDGDSFLGKIRSRTGLNFDLPTEAQWEYACRAGTTSMYNNGGSSENDLKTLGRYYGNATDGRGGYNTAHTRVGSYLPNAWGLYDMHGNVGEWCLDWQGSIAGGDDPKGSLSGSDRVNRGGSWNYYVATDCGSSYRSSVYPAYKYITLGFRLAIAVSNQ